MKNLKILPLLLALLLTGCAPKNDDPSLSEQLSETESGEKVEIQWDVSPLASVSVAGYKTLPTSVNKNTKLVLDVDVNDNNYAIDMVTCNDVKAFDYGSGYKIEITRDSVIKVITAVAIEELQISKKPTKLLYNVDDNFDPTGLEVTALYKDNSTEIIPLNTLDSSGYYFYPIMFKGGEDKVQVFYKDKVADIMLDATVESYVSIDPNGGTISNEYISKLQALNLKNFSISGTGVISFNHSSDLPCDITLPTEEEVTKPGNKLLSWGVSSNVIPANAKGCVNAKASWKLDLVEVKKVYMLLENTTPYLIIDGSFNSVESVYLYLYEGSAKISIEGDTYTKTTSNDFQVKFDLTKLSSAGSKYHGKWMDIRFNTVINGVTESMEFNVVENPTIEVDLNQSIFTTTHSYHFATYNNFLKVYYKNGGYQYNISFSSDDTHDYVTFDGKTSTLFKGATLQISWWVTSVGEDVFRTTTINEDGSFSLKVEMDAFPNSKDCYAHITILDAEDNILFGSTSTNFLQSCSKTSLTALVPSGSTIKNCVSYETDKATYYIGGNGTGLMHYSIAK